MIQLQYFGLASFGANLFLLFNLCIRLGYPSLRVQFFLLYMFVLSIFVLGYAQNLRNGKAPFNGPMLIVFLVISIGGLLAWT